MSFLLHFLINYYSSFDPAATALSIFLFNAPLYFVHFRKTNVSVSKRFRKTFYINLVAASGRSVA